MIFWKYCLRYFAAFLVIIVCCLLLTQVAYRSIEQYVIAENQIKLEEGVNEIRQQIVRIDSASDIFRGDSYFETLCSAKTELPPEKYLNLKYANDQFRNIGIVQGFFPYGFGLFQNNDLYISSEWCSDSLSRYYGSLLQASDGAVLPLKTFKEQLFQKAQAGPAFWRVDSFAYYAGGQRYTVANAILCIVADKTSYVCNTPYVLAFVIRPQDVEQRILTAGNLKNGVVRIVNGADGKILLDTTPREGPAGGKKKYCFLKYSIHELNWDVTIGFPKSIIAAQCRQIRTTMDLYLLIGFMLMIGLTLYFSSREYANVKGLIGKFPDAPHTHGRGRNEYDFLKQSISDILRNQALYESRIDELALQNKAILLENLMVRGVNTREEAERLRELFPGPLEYFCVALVSIGASQAEPHRLAVLCIREYFQKNYPYGFVNVSTGVRDELFLFSLAPQDAPTAQNIRRLFRGIIPALTADMGLTFAVGISAVGTDTANIGACYHQARQVIQAYAAENQNVIEIYHVDINAVHENAVDMEFVDKLYHLLLCAEKGAIHRQFARLVSCCRKAPIQFERQKQQIFFTIRNVIYNACLHLALDAEGVLPVYQSTVTVQEMADALEKAADSVCGQIERNKKSKNIRLRQRMMQSIGENYANPALTANVICRAIGISEKYLCQFIKEQTGETFSAYLERLRIGKAAEYLESTDMSNERIAASTGFAAVNTFYRAFSKRMGVPPGVYRKSSRAAR